MGTGRARDTVRQLCRDGIVRSGAGRPGDAGRPGRCRAVPRALARRRRGLSFVVSLLGLVVGAAAIRTFVTEDTETLPGSRFTDNVGWLLVNLLVGYIVFAIVVGIGFVFLIIPGFFLLVSLWFWGAVVAVEDENFVAGFSRSWSLTGGNRIMLFVLGVIVVVVAIVISIVFGIVAFAGGWIGLLINQIGSALVTVFVLATTARAYVQLTSEDEDLDGDGVAA